MLSAAPDVDIAVQLESDDPVEVTVPASVTVAAGQTTGSFTATIIDDPRLDGPVTTTVRAAVANWTSGSVDITVADNENTSLVVNLPASAREGDAPISGTVQISGTMAGDVIVALASSDMSELTVPASVTIVAG